MKISIILIFNNNNKNNDNTNHNNSNCCNNNNENIGYVMLPKPQVTSRASIGLWLRAADPLCRTGSGSIRELENIICDWERFGLFPSLSSNYPNGQELSGDNNYSLIEFTPKCNLISSRSSEPFSLSLCSSSCNTRPGTRCCCCPVLSSGSRGHCGLSAAKSTGPSCREKRRRRGGGGRERGRISVIRYVSAHGAAVFTLHALKASS